ncbi:MAG: FkbM family methyltransferase [Bacteroidales bacterium]|nr:FkbM family methyltransferase [Bacteroidales bacterium]
MKNTLIFFLQKLLGFNNYLFVFALFTYYRLRTNKKEKDFFKIFDLIEGDGIILDIGANIGVMTAHFAKNKKNSLVYSFEPVPENIRALKRVVRYFKLKNVKIMENALSDFDGEIDMLMPKEKRAKKQGLSHVVNENDKNNEEGSLYRVPVKKLDNISELANSDTKIKAIKIDVEGHEFKVLQGAKNILQKNKPVVYCELWNTSQRGEVIKFMESLNYKTKVVEKNVLCDFKNQLTQNFFFVNSEELS